MRVRFVGDPSDDFSGPNNIVHWGVEFVKNEWVDGVSDQRFATHNHFEVDDGEATPRRRTKAQEEGA